MAQMADTGDSNSNIEAFARECKTGTVLFHEGDVGKEMYVIQSGSVAITRVIGGETKTLAKLPVGEFFGEMAILNDRPRSATAMVIEDSTLLVIQADTLETMLRSRPEIAVRLITTLSSRLAGANQQIELLLVSDNTYRVAMALRQLAGDATPDMGAVFIDTSVNELASLTDLPRDELLDILQRLAIARLAIFAEEAGIEREGFVVPEVGRLQEFMEYLEMKDRFGAVGS